jgi:hypothetical protein
LIAGAMTLSTIRPMMIDMCKTAEMMKQRITGLAHHSGVVPRGTPGL